VELRNLGVKNSTDFPNTNKVMAFKIVDTPPDPTNNFVAAELDPYCPAMTLTAAQSKKTRKFRVKRDLTTWTIADMTWDDVVASDYKATFANPSLNDVEIWEIENSSGGWFHPVHIHLVDFQVLARNGKPPRPEEKGPKDVVYIGESETVRLLVRFEHRTGRYMMHCHNLPHEDHDMMTQFEVGKDGPSPFADPAKPMPAPAFPGTTA
jgi:FtsP/CotA-like multicopper oxidase with cupredoxin domain